MTQYRLLARAEMDGAIRDPGYIFELAEGQKGPHRTVVASDHGAQITDHMGAEAALVDEPLFEEVKDAPLPEKPPEVELSAEHVQDKGRITTLEADLADKDKQLREAHWRLSEVEAALKMPAPLLDGGGDLSKPLLLEAPESNLPAKA